MMRSLAAWAIGPVQFDAPHWLWLAFPMMLITVWIGRKSLSGLGTNSRRAALALRLAVIAVVCAAMAEPSRREESSDVSVTAVLDVSRSVPLEWQGKSESYVEAARQAGAKPDDRLGVVTLGRDSIVQQLPSKLATRVERQTVVAGDATDIASGIQLALATIPKDAAGRLLLVTDGNETSGNVMDAASAAQAKGVPIDVLPIQYTYPGEVVAEELIVPATARMGETVNVTASLRATRASTGRLSLTQNDVPVDLDPLSPGQSAEVTLSPGMNRFRFPVTVRGAGAQGFKLTFEPSGSGGVGVAAGDVIAENNQAMGVTFVSGQGRVLVVSDDTRSSAALVEALTDSKIESTVVAADQFPSSLTELAGLDAVVLVNQPASSFSTQTQEDLKRYIHDMGGGLVMIGGDQSFGAGGWLGSPLEDALPIRLDPPQKRQMPKGALCLVMHSIEMPNGVHYGQETARKAVDALSRLDLVGINEYRGMSGVEWVYPLQEVGDGAAVKRAIKSLQFGDMPDFGPSVQLAYDALMGAPDVGVRHMIIISDGDPSPPSNRLLQLCRKNKITISTVGVFPHSPGDLGNMQFIAQQTGGRYYEVTTDAGLGKITQIFIKEAQTVKRSLVWEGEAFAPAMTGVPTEAMRGITGVPPISGYVVAADREGLSQVTLRGKENDPILAQWQHGLGRVVTFTSDAAPKWSPSWTQWPGYRSFWEQHVRWAMRPSGSANARVTMEKQGDRTRVVLELRDAGGERLNFAKIEGRLATPDGKGVDVELRETGQGRYEAEVETADQGSYLLGLKYAASGKDGQARQGSVQSAITRPFADEFRALEDNEPLLKQVAQLTGGRVLAGDPNADELWRRDGLKMPVALTPAWVPAMLLACGLFLADVAVRRVRIDLVAIAGRARKMFGRGKTVAGAQVDSLRAAREKAQKQMRARGAGTEAREADVPAPIVDVVSKSKKFEAAEGAGRGGIEVAGESRTAPIVDKSKAKPAADKKDEEGMSRLMKAKKRAQDEMKDE